MRQFGGTWEAEPEAGSVSHAPQGEGVKSPALKGECCDLFAQGLNGNGLVHDCVEVIHSHGGQDAVNGIFQRGVALHHGHADVDIAFICHKIIVRAGEVQNDHIRVGGHSAHGGGHIGADEIHSAISMAGAVSAAV